MILKNNKANIQQVFVYLLSIIMILFVGFLVTKFIITFQNDVDTRSQVKLYSSLEDDFKKVYTTYGSEKYLEYRLPTDITLVCFIVNAGCIDSLSEISLDSKKSLKTIVNTGDNVIQLDSAGVVNSRDIGNFYVTSGCKCIKPNNNIIKIIMENKKNKVFISEDLE